jgi:DNA-binding transcriptional MocR family regulator
MVVNGAVSGFALVLRMMTGPGDRVVVDHPTYPLAIAAIQGAQCRPVGVSLPETGWDTDGFAATLAQTAPRLAYLMPDFHNPPGAVWISPPVRPLPILLRKPVRRWW